MGELAQKSKDSGNAMVKEKNWNKAEHYYKEAIAYIETIKKENRSTYKDLHRTIL